MHFEELLAPDVVAHDEEIIRLLKESSLPIVMYGATIDVADQIVKKLRANGLEIAYVTFAEGVPVMTNETHLLKEVELISVEALDSRLGAYHVVLGYVKVYNQADAIAGQLKNARSVSYFSEIFDMEPIRASFVRENKDCLKRLYDELLDQHSKDSLVAYLMSKTRQDMKYLPPIFDKIQYFPTGMFEWTEHESYFDCGAFTGDTIAEFLKAAGGHYRQIWAAEPDRTNYQQLMRYIRSEGLSNVEVVNKGIYGYAGKLPFQEEGSMLSMITDDADHFIEVDTIDRIAAGEPVTYIKMDVEGAELMALKGAEQTIRKYKPVLGISIYHKERDLIDIPAYIKELEPSYRFYFRVHKKLAIDTVLYGVVK